MSIMNPMACSLNAMEVLLGIHYLIAFTEKLYLLVIHIFRFRTINNLNRFNPVSFSKIKVIKFNEISDNGFKIGLPTMSLASFID